MSLRRGGIAPDFTADSAEGRIGFHDCIGGLVGDPLLPRAFTPVCTTELGDAARLKPEFDRRNVKVKRRCGRPSG